MSIAVIKIKTCAYFKQFDAEVNCAKNDLRNRFRDLLSFLHNLSTPESIGYEVSFLGQNSNPRLLLSVHCLDEVASSITADTVAEHIITSLRRSYYSCEKLSGKDLSVTASAICKALSGDVVILTKSEKLIASPSSYSGYFYYTDTFESNDYSNDRLDNYNSLFDLLSNSDNSLVSFQLIPTLLSQAELYALSSLSSELNNITRGISVGGRLYRENLAEEPQKCYVYYTERRSQPLFFCNILVASPKKNSDNLSAALKASIQASVSHPVGIDALRITLEQQVVRDFFALPWNLANITLFNYRNQSIWNGSPFQPTNLMRLPFLYTADEASVFFRLPIDDGEIHGIKSSKVKSTNETISTKVTDSSNIQFGTLLNSPDTTIGARLSDFTRHGLIVGTPGSGKTTFAINLLLQFYRKGIPFLTIEPTKTEYRAMYDRISELQIFTPGNSGVSPFSINPFAPPEGITIEQYIPSLMDAFKAAFDMESPLDVIFSSAVRKCYTKYGWKNDSKVGDANVQPFGLYEFILTFRELVSSSNYSKDVRSNIETGGTFRLMNLIQQNSMLYDSVNSVNIRELLSKPTVLELNAISDDEQKALLIALLLIQVSLYTKSLGASNGQLTNVILLDEAHVLLGSNDDVQQNNKAKSSAVRLFQKMIAEIRSFGTSVIVADQVPSQVTRSIVANTDMKFAFRLVEKDEREIIANSAGMSDEYMEHLARLQTGEAIVYYSRLESPKIVFTPNIRAKEGIRLNVSDTEVRELFERSRPERPFYECKWCRQCKDGCTVEIRTKADFYASHIAIQLGSKIRDKETLIKFIYKLHDLIIQYEKENERVFPIRLLCNCSKIQFLRKILLESNFSLDRRTIDKLLHETLILEVIT